MNKKLNVKHLDCDICIIGGGLAGSFAAIEAAKGGSKVVLMQDRPVLGGNASSEIRMWVRGAGGAFNRETGLISDLEERNIYYNPTLCHSLFDATLYAMVEEHKNIQILMNTTCLDAKTENNSIVSVTGWQLTTYTYYEVSSRIFMDCSGDSILADLVGAEYRHGREDKAEFAEELGQPKADSRTMGMSIILAARETDHKVKFVPPPFANVYPDDDCFSGDMGQNVHGQIRDHKVATSGANLWWVELGGECNSIYDADKTRAELLACIYGVWDHIKNHGDHGMDNWELEWVGALPGKRESRRYIGDYVLSESDIKSGGHFADEVAYGGWPMDDHNPYGMRKNDEALCPSVMIPVTEPYGIPVRCLYSKNVDNLMFAGRNISVTHVALSSSRVMATCALLGQAAGCTAAVAIAEGVTPREAATDHIKTIQKILMDNGVFLPHIKRESSKLMQGAAWNVSDEEREILLNGVERPRNNANENSITQDVGDELKIRFDKAESIASLRLCFDPDFSRRSISENKKMRVFAMKLHTGKDFKPVTVAKTLVKDFVVYADGKEVARVENNYHRIVVVALNVEARELSVKWLATNGSERVRIFSVDVNEANK